METWRVTAATRRTGLQDQSHQDPCVHQAESSGSRELAVGPVLARVLFAAICQRRGPVFQAGARPQLRLRSAAMGTKS